MAAPVEPGTVLAGKYRIDRVLGEGGMGVVVAATHLQLEERVAIKFLLPEAISSGDIVNRFAREARAAAKIQSEHVARVRDVGTLDSGAPYMVMEFLEGRDLSAYLEEVRTIPCDEAVQYLLQACEAIAEAHAAGIVHRDLKPANLFLANRADKSVSVKVLDFGISKTKTLGATDAALTKTTAIMGSPLYMSPEQMRASKDADARSDIWSLGCILYECLCGRTPFIAESMTEIVAQVLAVEPQPVTALRPDCPAGLAAAVHRCLAKDPTARFEDVSGLAAAIAPFGPDQQGAITVERVTRVLGTTRVPAVRIASVADASSAAATAKTIMAGTNASWGSTGEGAGTARVKSSRGPLVVGVALALAAVGAAGFVAMRSPAPTMDGPAAAAVAAVAPTTSVASAAAPLPSAPAPGQGASGAVAPQATASTAPAPPAGHPPPRPHRAATAAPSPAAPPAPAKSPAASEPKKNPLQIDLK